MKYEVGQKLRLINNYFMNVDLNVGEECKIVHISKIANVEILHLRFERDVNDGYDEFGGNQICSEKLVDKQFELIY